MLLKDKVAIVSGVGPGLGRATALALAREGAAVGLAARTEERVQSVAEEIEAMGGRAIALATNVVDPDDCARAVAETVDAFGGLDILVNSAFRGDGGAAFADADLKKWRKVFEVNVWGSLQLTPAAPSCSSTR
jgi:NAD(P)-dependent dehydrogenase (short-subunit alcohol dehydrogenase family)